MGVGRAIKIECDKDNCSEREEGGVEQCLRCAVMLQKMKNMREEIGADAIPEGLYCYTYTGQIGVFGPETEACPYWGRVKSRDSKQDGWCIYMGKGDLEIEEAGFTSLLWDRCKECGVNMDDDNDIDVKRRKQ